jgi:hypothetical protein
MRFRGALFGVLLFFAPAARAGGRVKVSENGNGSSGRQACIQDCLF